MSPCAWFCLISFLSDSVHSLSLQLYIIYYLFIYWALNFIDYIFISWSSSYFHNLPLKWILLFMFWVLYSLTILNILIINTVLDTFNIFSLWGEGFQFCCLFVMADGFYMVILNGERRLEKTWAACVPFSRADALASVTHVPEGVLPLALESPFQGSAGRRIPQLQQVSQWVYLSFKLHFFYI